MSSPSYIASAKNGHLDKVIDELRALLNSCAICPRKCGVDRTAGRTGFCKTGNKAKVYSFMSHKGEEPAVSGERGSGTIFFSNCNMSCVYCQNYEFSQLGQGRQVEDDELARFMLKLQEMGCHNINLVSPTHVLPQILSALKEAIGLGLNVPLVHNTSGYELPEVVRLLEGIVDIYLADIRYMDEEPSVKYSSAPGYPGYCRQSLKEMRRQIPFDEIDDKGIIKRGLIIRHLVLPNNISGTEEAMRFICEELSPDTLVSLMSQYLPYHRAKEYPAVSRRLTVKEYEEAQAILEKYGLHNGWVQESFGLERFAGVNIKSVLKEDE